MTNTITVLGAYGTKSGKVGSSAFLLDEKTTIDAGNLMTPLGAKCAKLESIWLTHSHLDHIIDIAFVIDNYYERREKTLRIYALKETIEALKIHFFNHTIWPDFSQIPLANGSDMCITYEVINIGQTYRLDEKSVIKAFTTDHTVASCGYQVTKNDTRLLITADTYSLVDIITHVNTTKNIRVLVVECSFPSRMENLARESKHLTPKLLFQALEALEDKSLQIYVNHIKPEYEMQIHEEIEQMKGVWEVKVLTDGDTITF